MDYKNNSIDNIVKVILDSKDIIVVGHTSPDGDCIGATTALCHALKQIGMKPKLLLEECNNRYDIIPYKEFLYKGDLDDIQTVIFMDCADLGRVPKEWVELEKKAINSINIDHHISNNYFAKYNYVIPGFSSTSEIAYNFINRLCDLNKDISTCLYAGIVYDTGGFRHSCTTKDTHKITAELMSFDIAHEDIYFNILSVKTLKEMKVLQLVIDRINTLNNGKINYSYVLYEDFKKLNITKNDLSGMVNALTSLENSDVSFFIYQSASEEFKVSLRSKKTDVNAVANAFNGGGHINASGCKLTGKFDECLNSLLNKITEVVNNE